MDCLERKYSKFLSPLKSVTVINYVFYPVGDRFVSQKVVQNLRFTQLSIRVQCRGDRGQVTAPAKKSQIVHSWMPETL